MSMNRDQSRVLEFSSFTKSRDYNLLTKYIVSRKDTASAIVLNHFEFIV